MVVALPKCPFLPSYCSVGGKVVVVGDGEEAGGPMDAKPGTGARCVKTGVTGEYGGRGGVPGRSLLPSPSWRFIEVMSSMSGLSTSFECCEEVDEFSADGVATLCSLCSFS